jgi:two-component system response regulator WspF
MKLVVAHRERLVREALRRSLGKSRFELAAQAGDLESLKKECRKQAPQLLLVELELLGDKAEQLPGLLELGASVIALASSAKAGAYEAMGHGALGLIEPPSIDESGELIGAQRLLSRLDRLVGVAAAVPAGTPSSKLHSSHHTPILAIGASTGGPLALAKVLSDLPTDIDASVLIVQHIEGEFSGGLVEWLGGQCRLPVALAMRGATPEPGKVYVAGPGGHLVLSPSWQFGMKAAQPHELHAPSINALFLSLAERVDEGAAVILTGMGSDGVEGMSALQRRGWLTLAQDEGTSAVYGMPRAAFEIGAAMQSLALHAIGPVLARHFRQQQLRKRSG